MSPVRTLPLLLLLLALPSRAQEAPGGPADPAKPESKEATKSGRIEIVAPGAEPRAKLRYRWKKGVKQRIVLTTKMTTTVQGMTQPGATQKHTVDLEIVEVAENGDATVSGRYVDVELEGMVNPVMRQTLAKLKSATFEIVLSPTGRTKSVEVDGAEKDVVPQEITHGVIEFPPGKIGVGGSWKRTERNEHGGLVVDATETFKVTSVEDGRVTVGLSGTMSAPKQKFQPPGVPMEVQLDSMKGTVNGDGTVVLGRPLPPSATATAKIEMTLTAGANTMAVKNESENEIREQTTTASGE